MNRYDNTTNSNSSILTDETGGNDEEIMGQMF